MKIFAIIVLLTTFLFSKECYFNKVNTVCYYKYFKKSNIYAAKADEKYYVTANGNIYTFDKTIEVKFNSIGAVFALVNDFELEFVDKIKNETYLFKVAQRSDLFATISKLNHLDTIMKAQPYQKQKFTKEYVQRKLEEKKARYEEAMKKARNRLDTKNHAPETINKKNIGFNFSEENEDDGEKKSFLKGNINE